jgi:hypothetical protein
MPLVTDGPAPEGYVIQPDTPWADIIADGVKHGRITLEGDCQVAIPVPSVAAPVALHV